MATTLNNSVTSPSGGSGDNDGTNDQDNTMTVLIVLVCVIGFIALVLSVVLVIVCLRRRKPKVELIEHVYAVPAHVMSNCQGLTHTYLGDDADPPPPPPGTIPRPRLVQAYSDVADARPLDQPPQLTPASPAYAEVEEMDSPADDKSRGGKRFQFRFRSKRPSVSSTGGMSSLYEDVNPLPINSVSKNNPAAVKSNTLPKNSGSKISSASGRGPNSTGGKKGGKGRGGSDSPKTVRESPVYVHVVDSADVKSSHNSTATEKTAVAPLAAKFIASIDKTASAKGVPRGKTENSARLYPLQEGRVANLVSTLNRKKDTINGMGGKEETGTVS